MADEHDDDQEFIRLELDHSGEGPILSRAAWMLHMHATVRSVRAGHPGFVDDGYLNAISAETTIATVELETAGLWERTEGGYQIKDEATLGMAIRFSEAADRRVEDEDEEEE